MKAPVVAVGLAMSLLSCSSSADDIAGFDEASGVLHEDLRIDGWEEEFDFISPNFGVAVSPSGTIAVAMRSGVIRFYSPSGERLGQFGGPGEGPGEFAQVGRMGWHGDTFWVSDQALRRLTFVTSDLQLSATSPAPGAVMALSADGWALVGSAPEGTLQIDRVGSDGSSMNPVFVTPAVTDNLSSADVTLPFGNTPRSATQANGARSALAQASLDGPDAGTILLTSLSADGDTAFSRRYRFESQPISRAEADSVIGALVQLLTDLGQSRGAASVRSEAQVPPMWPPLDYLVVGDDESTWVVVRGDGTSQRVHVTDAEGDPLGTVTLPPRTHLAVGRTDQIWTVQLDELNVPSIVRYQVVWE